VVSLAANLSNIFAVYNEDCRTGAKKHLQDNSVDLIITDPPYGIRGDQLHKHYNRKEGYVIDDYIEITQSEYPDFSREWIKEAERVLRPGGSLYIFSGYTNLVHILNALKETGLKEKNHIIWKYNFGVYTSRKYVSSHFHILYYVKKGKKPTFNLNSRFGNNEIDKNNKKLNYKDREDVWIINREYKPGQIKNKNELPKELLIKMIQYSSNENDLVCDFFLGSFSTIKVALGLKRRAVGFEKSKKIFKYQKKEIKGFIWGTLIPTLRKPKISRDEKHGLRWEKESEENLIQRYQELCKEKKTKKETIKILSEEFQRGYFSILNRIKKLENLPI
jgi:site-specific DNA-methyltransferase (adenine-specific)